MCLAPRSTTGWGRREKKARLDDKYIGWVRQKFSGYLVIDEVHDGPYTIFYAVDPLAKTRVGFMVTEEGSSDATARQFLIQLQTLPLVVLGVTTDGSSIYRLPLEEVFPGAVHQVCQFHMIHKMNLIALRVVAQVRKRLRASVPRRPRGNPNRKRSEKEKRLERQHQRVRDNAARLWDNRHLFVQKKLTAAEQATVRRMVRGQPELRALREFLDAIHQLFDRRCSTATALTKLERLRRRHLFAQIPSLQPLLVKLRSPNLDKALEFLDDDLLEPTSNAAERANRRYRKIQKTVYRFRCRRMIVARITLDMLWQFERERRAPPMSAFFSSAARLRAVA